VRFVWDAKKARANWLKHRVSFEEAATGFYETLAKVAADPDHSASEDRFILIGHSTRKNLLFVVHVYREKDEVIRIVSARKATKREKKDFEKSALGE
jgi:uncharacterized protein